LGSRDIATQRYSRVFTTGEFSPDNVCGGTAPLQDSLDVVSEMDKISANPTVVVSQNMSFPVGGQQTVTNKKKFDIS
jgi:hypothetical protein